MKSIILSAILLLSVQLKAQQGWIYQQAPAGVYYLNKVIALSPDVAFAAGDSCKIIKTSDGGAHWNIIYKDDSNHTDLNSIFFIDTLRGWAVGWGIILSTVDGGKNWQRRIFNFDAMLKFSSVYFINPDTGWVAGGGFGTILRTFDGGVVWDKIATPASFNILNDIYFTDSKNGFAVGSEAGWTQVQHGVLLISSDGGDTWGYNTTEDLSSLFFINSKTGWLCGGPYLYFTNDGGKNWESSILNYYLNAICFVNDLRGWAIGNNFMLSTIDGGQNWIMQDSIVSKTKRTNLLSVDFCNESTGWTVGKEKEWITGKSNAIILKTTTGGITNIKNPGSKIPGKFLLFQNYPNPFNPSTMIRYAIPKETNVKIKVYDVLGKEITTLLNTTQKAGQHEVEWNEKNCASGIYFYRIKAGKFVSTKKMLLMK